jgi:hypothetical protein
MSGKISGSPAQHAIGHAIPGTSSPLSVGSKAESDCDRLKTPTNILAQRSCLLPRLFLPPFPPSFPPSLPKAVVVSLSTSLLQLVEST